MWRFALFILLGLLFRPAHAEVVVRDDSGHTIRLPAPTRRIVSLAPHITENLFSAGAGDRLIGAVDHSDYPAAARNIPRLGSYARLDMERVLAMKPDLVIAWGSGNTREEVERLKSLGIPVFISEPETLGDIAGQIEKFGRLAGTDKTARLAAATYRQRLALLQRQYAGKRPVRVFYQVWKPPLLTVGGQQIISKVIDLCGGENIFGHIGTLAPVVTVEAVLAARPEVIVASGMDEARPEWLDDWLVWKTIPAVANGDLGFIPPELMQRHTMRLLDGAERLCHLLDKARGRPQ